MTEEFYLTLDISMRIDVPIQASSLESAIQKAQKENFELPSLNDGYITKTNMKYILDNNYNVVYKY